jgi:hypothetical protein
MNKLTPENLEKLGYKRFDWNGGSIPEYWKSIGESEDDFNRRVSVRFGEWNDRPHVVYLVQVQNHSVIKHIKTTWELEQLYSMLSGRPCTFPFEEGSSDEIYRNFWADLVETDGKLDLGKLKDELYDFYWIMSAVREVYCHVTGGAISKPNTSAAAVIAVHDDLITNDYKHKDDILEVVNNWIEWAVTPQGGQVAQAIKTGLGLNSYEKNRNER